MIGMGASPELLANIHWVAWFAVGTVVVIGALLIAHAEWRHHRLKAHITQIGKPQS